MNGKHIAVLAAVAAVALLISFSLQYRQPAPTAAPQATQAQPSSSQEEGTTTAPRSIGASSATVVQKQSALASLAPTVSSTTAQIPQPTVTLELIEPDGTSTFPVELKQGADACAVLEEAKAESELSSLTLDDSYKTSFGSSYVREINGFSNDWTFSVGGVEPEGCSLYTPKAGDTIVWTFGAGD